MCRTPGRSPSSVSTLSTILIVPSCRRRHSVWPKLRFTCPDACVGGSYLRERRAQRSVLSPLFQTVVVTDYHTENRQGESASVPPRRSRECGAAVGHTLWLEVADTRSERGSLRPHPLPALPHGPFAVVESLARLVKRIHGGLHPVMKLNTAPASLRQLGLRFAAGNVNSGRKLPPLGKLRV